MTPSDELVLADYANPSGKLVSATSASEWNRPVSVELVATATRSVPLPFGSELRTKILPPPALFLGRNRIVKPDSKLLERFLNLADASDQKICEFARRYGYLLAFNSSSQGFHVEYCQIWRYFARVMMALLRISSKLEAGPKASKEDWDIIEQVPDAIENWPYDDPDSPPDREIEWAMAASLVNRFQDRGQFVRLTNSLLRLGGVRPWMLWPKDATRPRLVYSSPRLFSYLALQLCLRLGRLDAFVICHHCRKEYTPPHRAPRAGTHPFYPECREAGIPQKYALKAYRERKRSESNV